jgi:hypothetical protein
MSIHWRRSKIVPVLLRDKKVKALARVLDFLP